LFFELLQIFARRYFRHAQALAELGNRDFVLLAQHLNDALASLFTGKGGELMLAGFIVSSC
jgi:hypothetical protein